MTNPNKISKTILRDSAILSFKDFQRIKRSSQFNPEPDAIQLQTMQSKEAFLQKAQNHRERIKCYDKLHRAENTQETEEEKYQRIKNEEILERAEKILESEDDAVKTMDKMVLYAEIATIRDRQREDRKNMEKFYKKKEEKLDIMMEINRLKEMEIQRKVEEEKKRQQREGALVVIDQIKAIQAEREKQKELLEIEKQQLLEKIKKEDDIAKQKQIEIDKRNERIMKEILEANKRAIYEKEKRKQEDRDLDNKLIAYNKEKARLEELRFQELKKEKEMKELELQKLREKQEKVADNQSIIDTIRARRAFEENNRLEREKEERDAQLRYQKLQDLIASNNKIRKMKQSQLAEAAKAEKEEFEKILREQIAEKERLEELERIKLQKLYEHNIELRKQIKMKEEQRDLEKREILEEGRKVRQNNQKYLKNFERIKQEKINYLKSLNVKPLYIADLERFQVKI